MKTVAIIQARLGSQRLPNKVLLEVVPGISMLEMVVRKAWLATLVHEVIVTSPDFKICTVTRLFCGHTAVYQYSGKRDVVREYWAAATQHNLQDMNLMGPIVRLTADCPLLRPQEIDKCIQAFLDNEVDLVYNTECEKDMTGDGLDVEVFSRGALEMAHKYSKDREHVTSWMRKELKTLFVPAPEFEGCSVDTQEDYERVCEIMRRGK